MEKNYLYQFFRLFSKIKKEKVIEPFKEVELIMAKSSNVSRINEAYIEQHDAYIRRQKQRKKAIISTTCFVRPSCHDYNSLCYYLSH